MGPFLYLIFSADISSSITDPHTIISAYADDTKLLRQITSKEDSAILQRSIDEFCEWATRNKLAINASKTSRMSYKRFNTFTTDTFYYVDATPINQPKTVRDLGILFDEKLAFQEHKMAIMQRARAMYGAAWRFSREIHSNGALLRVINTYIHPIITYASPIWLSDNDTVFHTTEEFLRKATRTILNLPFSNLHPNYHSYSARLNMLGIASMKERIIANWIIFTLRVVKGDTNFQLGENIIMRRRQNQRTRNPHIFTTYDLPIGDALKKMMDWTNTYRHLINFDETITTNRRRIIHEMITSRAAIFDM